MAKLFSGVLVVCFLSLVFPSLLFADSTIENGYDFTGTLGQREMLSSTPEERIDPLTGAVSYSYVDAKLPGNGGLDLVIQRTFNSKDMCYAWTLPGSVWSCNTYGEKTWMGFGWQLHLGDSSRRMYTL